VRTFDGGLTAPLGDHTGAVAALGIAVAALGISAVGEDGGDALPLFL
jgi:hypothetical protein